MPHRVTEAWAICAGRVQSAVLDLRPLLAAGVAIIAALGFALAPPDDVDAGTPLCVPDQGAEPFAGWPVAGDAELEAWPLGRAYVVGVLRSGTPERGASAAVSNLCPLRDFVLEVDAQLAEGSQAGYAIHLRQHSERERLTLLVDAERRLASFYRRSEGRSTVLWGWAPVAALRGGTERDRIRVRAVGSRVSVEANGVPLFDLAVAGPEGGSVWLGVVTWGSPARAIFSDLALATPD